MYESIAINYREMHSLFSYIIIIYIAMWIYLHMYLLRMLKVVIQRIAALLNFSSLSLQSHVVVQGMLFHIFQIIVCGYICLVM